MNATKRIGCTLLALAFLLLAGCAAPPQAKADDAASDFVFGEDGYAYAPAPFGSTREELEAALGSEMIDKGSNPHTDPFEYLSYVTPNQDAAFRPEPDKPRRRAVHRGRRAFRDHL